VDVDAGREPPVVGPDISPVTEPELIPEPTVPEQAKSPDEVTSGAPAEADDATGTDTDDEPETKADAKTETAAETDTAVATDGDETTEETDAETDSTDQAADEPVADTTDSIPPPRSRSTSHKVMFGVGRSVIALAAAAVLTVTGYNWSVLHQLDNGIARTDVFGGNPAPTGGQAGGPAPVVPPPLTSDVNILLVGMDSRTDPHGNPLPQWKLDMLHAGPDTGELDTDTMILLHIPAGGQQAVAVSFPRDSYVQLAGGFGKHRLNSAFAYAHNARASQLRDQGVTDSAEVERDADTAGRKNLIATIEQLIGNSVTINRYAEVNLAGFYDMSRAVGGVNVCLKAATHDSFTHASFPAGVQTVSGVQALNFVRQRHGLVNGDLDRITRQQVFLGGLANKVLSTGTLTSPTRIAALTTAIQNSITLSSGWDITSFAEQMQGLSSGAIQFHTIPTGPNITAGGADVTKISQPDVEQFVRSLVDSTVGAPTTEPTTDPLSPPVTGVTSSANTISTTPSAPSTTPTTSDSGPITANGLRCVN
jgi:LCP family protein required for cell wall assembly